MARLSGEELSKLYPQPKSYDQLKAELEQRKQIRRPRFAPAQVGFYSTFVTVTALVGFWMVGSMMGGVFSAGEVLSGVSFSVLLCIACGGVIYLCYSAIRALTEVTLSFAVPLYAVLILIMIVTGLIVSLSVLSLGFIIVGLLFNFIAASVAMRIMMNRQK